MPADKNKEFINEYKKFYQMFFKCISKSVGFLADLHKTYRKQYDKILNFEDNPEKLEELIDNLSNEEKGILLSILFKASDFGRKFANLMEMSPSEKKEFAKSLEKFADELEKM